MEIRKAIGDLIRLPVSFYHGDKSAYALVRDSGYFELNDQINENDISDALSKEPDLVDQWLIWSENKRTSSGWYFTENKMSNKYVVSYFPNKRGLEKNEFSDRKLACAAFIKRETEEIRNLSYK